MGGLAEARRERALPKRGGERVEVRSEVRCLLLLAGSGLIVLGLLACDRSEAYPPSRAAEASPSAERMYRSDWGRLPAGSEPSEFVDVRAEGQTYPWLYGGAWRIGKYGRETVYEVPQALRKPAEPLTFRRYRGEAFGPDGALPPRYRVEAEARSMGGSMRFNGYGEVAMQVFYVSPTRYVEVLQTDEALLMWEADNAAPMQGSGWTQLARVPRGAKVGQWVRFGAEVDRERGTITALLDGKPVATARSGMLKGPGPARLTLRATGNREEWRWVEVKELGGQPAGSVSPGPEVLPEE